MEVRIYHNPRCSKSRQTLALLEEKDVKPEIIEYLKHSILAEELAGVIKLLGISPRALLRTKEAAYKENNLANMSLSDNEIITLMIENPSLMQRPIVVVDNEKARIGRPPETVLEIID